MSAGEFDQALQLMSHMEDAHLKDNKKVRHSLDFQRYDIHQQAGQLSKAEEACSRAILIVEDEESKEIDERDYSRNWRNYI